MITELVYWFIALLGMALVIMWIDSLLCNGKVKVHPSIERPLERQRVWAHLKYPDKWVFGYYDFESDALIVEGGFYHWGNIDYWVDLTEYK